MKFWILCAIIIVTAFPVFGQFQPCVTLKAQPFKMVASTQLIQNNSTGEYGTRVIYADGTYKDLFPSILPTRETEIVSAFSQVYKLNASSWWQLSFYMPADGRCVGAFESYDDRSDVYKVVQDAAGRYIRVPVRTAADVELLVIAEPEWQRIRGNISTSSYRAVWSSGRSYKGDIAVDLPKGWYRLVIYNGYSLAAKSVDLKFGGRLASRP